MPITAALKRPYEFANRTWRKITEREQGLYPVAHQGIQRSGTNYFCALLESADYKVINRVDPVRSDPSHKHTRWQHDKSSIVMDSGYRNDWQAENVKDVNVLAGFPEGTKHLVLFREPRDWMDSIYRWGLKCQWFMDEKHFFETGLYKSYLREWHEFYAAWAAFAAKDPDLVLLCNYSDIRRAPQQALQRIDTFWGPKPTAEKPKAQTITKVRHSKPMSEKREGLQDPRLEQAIAAGGPFNWKAHSWQATPA